MAYGASDFFTYDDPPAPQEPPQHHTPLPPPRSRSTSCFRHRPSSSSGSNKTRTRTSTPNGSPIARSHASKARTKSMDEIHRSTQGPKYPADSLSQSTITSKEDTASGDRLVTKDKSGIIASISLSPVDSQFPTSSTARSTHVTAAKSSPRKAGSLPHMGPGEHKQTPILCDVQGKPSLKERNISSNMTITTRHTGSPTSCSSDATQTEGVMPQSDLTMNRRDSEVNADGRSVISSFLDAYCRSDMGDVPEDETELMCANDASMVCTGETASLGYVADSPKTGFDDGPGSSSTCAVSPDIPTKRPKPTSLVITSSSSWEEECKALGLPTAPQTAPASRCPRPLPQLPPPAQRPIRPLPRPPLPSPYISPTDPNFSSPSNVSSMESVISTPQPSASPSAIPSPSSSNSTSSTLATPTSISSIDVLSAQPNISKRPLLAPLLTVSICSSVPPSPLTPDIPIPPSPMTAKRHQASKLSKMLGEEIPPELVYGRQGAPRPPLPNHLSVTGTKPVTNVNLTTKGSYTPAPILRFRDTQRNMTRLGARAERPQAIYVQDDTSEEFDDAGDGEEDEESMSEYAEGDSHDSHMGIKLGIVVGEELEDQTCLSPASSQKACSVATSSTDSSLEEYELDDMEEAHIGWALQNVITYEKASRVKRTSRMWILEKNGQRWEEEDYNNVVKALRQL